MVNPTSDFTIYQGVILGHDGDREQIDENTCYDLGMGGKRYRVLMPSATDSARVLTNSLEVSRMFLCFGPVNYQEEAEPALVVVGASPLHDVDPYRHIPSECCPCPEIMPGVLSLVDTIKSDPLREFVRNVLRRRDVFDLFWSMAASHKHHHAFEGGLASHSLDVAHDIGLQRALTDVERDLGVAGGLLHDIGKVWAYTARMRPTSEALAIGHELIGLERLHTELTTLSEAWPEGGHAMRSLLSGVTRRRAGDALPFSLLARIRAADQRSCERDKHNPARPGRSWLPKY
jgi:hypothetical protein